MIILIKDVFDRCIKVNLFYGEICLYKGLFGMRVGRLGYRLEVGVGMRVGVRG